MASINHIKNRLLSQPIAQRNMRNPFEFGNVRTQDRIQAAVRIKLNGQGLPLGAGGVLDTGLTIPNGIPPGVNSAKLAFRTVQRFFESWNVESRLRPWSVIGFMSDSLDPNGLAAVLHDESEDVQYINVTAGAFFHTLYSAYHLVSDQRFEPTLPLPGQFTEARADSLFGVNIRIPSSGERRKLATRFAVAALRITFFHELAHILRGHAVLMCRSIAKQSHEGIAEVSPLNSPLPLIVDLRRRALETDADDFSGRFMARQFFQDFTRAELTFENKKFRDRAFQVLVGVVLMYSWFAESDGYHSGSLRAYLVLGSMFIELGLDVKITAKWTTDRVDALQRLMVDGGLMKSLSSLSIDSIQVSELNEKTIEYREAHMHEWLQYRPWGFEGNKSLLP